MASRPEGLQLHAFETAQEMGVAAAQHAAKRIRELIAEHKTIAVVFATGASQLETLRALTSLPNIPWDRVIGFHLDEYAGLSCTHPASFRHYLRKELTSKVPLQAFHEIDAEAEDLEAVCLPYAALLQEHRPVLGLAGIGENGHLAFNDPPVANFEDPADVKLAELDIACRQQQVNEGWFRTIDEVPRQAVTVTIPALMRIPELILSVPGERKRAIVDRTLHEAISTACPATILRTHPNAHLYLDSASRACAKST